MDQIASTIVDESWSPTVALTRKAPILDEMPTGEAVLRRTPGGAGPAAGHRRSSAADDVGVGGRRATMMCRHVDNQSLTSDRRSSLSEKSDYGAGYLGVRTPTSTLKRGIHDETDSQMSGDEQSDRSPPLRPPPTRTSGRQNQQPPATTAHRTAVSANITSQSPPRMPRPRTRRPEANVGRTDAEGYLAVVNQPGIDGYLQMGDDANDNDEFFFQSYGFINPVATL